MPKLDTTLHLDMIRSWRQQRSFAGRLQKALRVLLRKSHGSRDFPMHPKRFAAAVEAFYAQNDLYGLQWGNPDVDPALMYVRDHFVLPYITPEKTVVEIGPGGGRWTRYLLTAALVYAVDYHQELLDELKANCDASNINYLKNNGDDFPGIPAGTIDFLFSFGTFVHLDADIIERYLRRMKRILKSDSTVVVQYSDKTKPLGRIDKGFSENDPARMRGLVLGHGYTIVEEDLETLPHSSIIRFRI